MFIQKHQEVYVNTKEMNQLWLMMMLSKIFMFVKITVLYLNLNKKTPGRNWWLWCLEMPLVNCEINLILTWPEKYVFSNDKKRTTFAITDTKLFAPVVTLSNPDNAKLGKKWKSGFKRTITWNKYEPEVSVEALNHIYIS